MVTAAKLPIQPVLSFAVGDIHMAATLQLQHWHVQLLQIQPPVQGCCALRCPELVRIQPTLSHAAAAVPALLQTMHKAEDAKSTTSEEFLDNLYKIVEKFQEKTKKYNHEKGLGDKADDPVLCYDNNKIQRIANISTLKYEKCPDIKLDESKQKVDLPTYSPDMNRPIEHIFGFIKPRVRAHVYERYEHYTSSKAGAKDLQTVVIQVLEKELVPGAVERDVAGLPLLWHVISTPRGEEYTDEKGDIHLGSEGDYPPAYYR